MNQVESFLKRPKLYYNIDGVGELGCGFLALGWGLLTWLQVHSPEHTFWHSMWVLCIYTGLMLSIIHYGTKAIKERITYPRTGFVEYRKRNRAWHLIIGGALGGLTVVGICIAAQSNWNWTAPAALAGLIFAAIYGYGLARTVRWKWAVAAAMALGSLIIAFLPENLIGALTDESMVTTVLPPRLERAYLLSIFLYGALMLISGGISFWLYLRYTQAPAEDAL